MVGSVGQKRRVRAQVCSVVPSSLPSYTPCVYMVPRPTLRVQLFRPIAVMFFSASYMELLTDLRSALCVTLVEKVFFSQI